MLRSTLNLGILAHVDAGKTTLSERLLYAAGAIDAVGRVDDGTTRTDSLALERERGITIRSAVAGFDIAGTAVNLIDTPGHPDFIAEVDRVLGVLDGAVLVVSAVEGVQPQTRVLMRALCRLQVPTLVFVNKLDRPGADPQRVLAQLARRLGLPAVLLVHPTGAGRPAATVTARTGADRRTALLEILTTVDDSLLRAYVEAPDTLTDDVVAAALRRSTAAGRVTPVFVGSAVTGTGVPELMAGLVDLLPTTSGDDAVPLHARVFKIERGPAGEKLATARLFGGSLQRRDRPGHPADPVTTLQVFAGGQWVPCDQVVAGQIARLGGLAHTRIGDHLGPAGPSGSERPGPQFAVPTVEAVVDPVRPGDQVRLRAALHDLAEQDPLIGVRDTGAEVAVSLYGEVQREVIGDTLARDYGLEVRFRGATPLYVERPQRTGAAVEVLNTPQNPFQATLGFRVAPGYPRSGLTLRTPVDHRDVPLYLYRTMAGFVTALADYLRPTLREGLRGWPVTDLVVTLTDCGYSVADGPPSRRGPTSTVGDFRGLAPMVLMAALDRAGTRVCEPVAAVRLETPGSTLGAVLAGLARLGAEVEGHRPAGDDVVVELRLPVSAVAELHRRLPGLTHGEGVLETRPAGHRPVRGRPPVRRRITVDPRHRELYVSALRRGGPVGG